MPYEDRGSASREDIQPLAPAQVLEEGVLASLD